MLYKMSFYIYLNELSQSFVMLAALWPAARSRIQLISVMSFGSHRFSHQTLHLDTQKYGQSMPTWSHGVHTDKSASLLSLWPWRQQEEKTRIKTWLVFCSHTPRKRSSITEHMIYRTLNTVVNLACLISSIWHIHHHHHHHVT